MKYISIKKVIDYNYRMKFERLNQGIEVDENQ